MDHFTVPTPRFAKTKNPEKAKLLTAYCSVVQMMVIFLFPDRLMLQVHRYIWLHKRPMRENEIVYCRGFYISFNLYAEKTFIRLDKRSQPELVLNLFLMVVLLVPGSFSQQITPILSDSGPFPYPMDLNLSVNPTY